MDALGIGQALGPARLISGRVLTVNGSNALPSQRQHGVNGGDFGLCAEEVCDVAAVAKTKSRAARASTAFREQKRFPHAKCSLRMPTSLGGSAA